MNLYQKYRDNDYVVLAVMLLFFAFILLTARMDSNDSVHEDRAQDRTYERD